MILTMLATLLCACKKKCANGHCWQLTSTTATCFDDGVENYACKNCKQTKTEAVSAYGHKLVQSSYNAPTCQTIGEKVEKCSRCGFENKTTLLPINCDYQVTSATPLDCTSTGSQILECTMCHNIKSEILPLSEHDYIVKSITPSTCTVNGSQILECIMCHDSKTETLPLKDHDFDADGYCTECGIYNLLSD